MKPPRPQQGARVSEVVRGETRAAYREAILDAATRVFGQRGFHDARIANIAAEAGVAAGTVYNYFKNKEEVFRSILERTDELLFQRIVSNQDLADPIERMRASLRTAFAFLEEHGALFSLYISIGGSSDWDQKRSAQALRNDHQARWDCPEKVDTFLMPRTSPPHGRRSSPRRQPGSSSRLTSGDVDDYRTLRSIPRWSSLRHLA